MKKIIYNFALIVLLFGCSKEYNEYVFSPDRGDIEIKCVYGGSYQMPVMISNKWSTIRDGFLPTRFNARPNDTVFAYYRIYNVYNYDQNVECACVQIGTDIWDCYDTLIVEDEDTTWTIGG